MMIQHLGIGEVFDHGASTGKDVGGPTECTGVGQTTGPRAVPFRVSPSADADYRERPVSNQAAETLAV